MAAINDIIIQIINGAITATGVNFGVPILIGFTGSRSIVRWGSGTSEMIAKSVVRHGFFSLTVIISGSSYIYAIDSENDITITVPTGARVRDLIADFNANAPVNVTNEISLVEVGSGAGPVVALALTESTFLDYLRVQNIVQIKYYYDGDDIEYKTISNILSSVPSPNVVYLLDAFGLSGDNLTSAIALRDNGDWFLGLSTTTDESLQITLNDYFDSVDRVLLMTSDTITRLSSVQGRHVAYAIHDAPNAHPEASWAAKALPFVPTQDWKFISSLQGQTANASASLTDLINVRAAKGNSYVRANGVSYMDGGQINDPDSVVFIDQVISRLWIKINLNIDLFNLFVQAAAQGGRIPYTNSGIAQLTGVLANRLQQAGQLGLIAEVSTQAQAAQSFDGKFRFKIQELSREQIELSSPNDIINRIYKGLKFSYIESGAIEQGEVTGTVLLIEV